MEPARTVPFEALGDLLAIDDTRSFSRAADRRSVSQPVLSRRIAALERWAGARLVARDTHRVALTAAGQALAQHAADALRSLEQGREDARDAEAERLHALPLASTHLLSSIFLPEWLASLEARLDPAPTVQLAVLTMVAAEAAMRDGTARMLLCHHTDEAPSELPARGFVEATIGRDVLRPVSAVQDGRVLFDPARDDPGKLPLLAYRPEAGLDRILRRSGALERAAARQWRPVFRSHAALTLRHLARLGRGIAWLPESLVADELHAGSLATVGGDALAVPVAIRLIRARARQNEAFERFWVAATRAWNDAGAPG